MISSFFKAVKDYLTGIFLYDLMSVAYAEKRSIDDLFTFGLFGTLIGFPHLFNYYHLRLMPYYVPRIHPWKRKVLREKDFFDQIRH
ncbi:MAG: hypothetical protein JW932_08725 [Deltaproteobacteria bacterium]|nr:hypothetical protein [Deltaproteobacteria bacterium]